MNLTNILLMISNYMCDVKLVYGLTIFYKKVFTSLQYLHYNLNLSFL